MDEEPVQDEKAAALQALLSQPEMAALKDMLTIEGRAAIISHLLALSSDDLRSMRAQLMTPASAES